MSKPRAMFKVGDEVVANTHTWGVVYGTIKSVTHGSRFVSTWYEIGKISAWERAGSEWVLPRSPLAELLFPEDK
jgi:hypothetical protein